MNPHSCVYLIMGVREAFQSAYFLTQHWITEASAKLLQEGHRC